MFYVWAYFNDCGKDFFLPDTHGWNGAVTIEQVDSGWNEDVSIPVRALDEKWFICCPDGYKWSNTRAGGEQVMHNDMRMIMNAENRSIGIVISECNKEATVFDKYVFPRNSVIKIGRNKANTICFENKLVGNEHAVLKRDESGGCTITDASRNGTYVNGRRVNQSSQSLKFGDVLFIAPGLKLVYMGDVLAVNHAEELAYVSLQKFAWPAYLSGSTGKKEELPRQPIYVQHQRAPRILLKPDTEPVEVEPPMAKQGMNTPPLLLTLGPSMTMMIPMLAGSLARSGNAGSYMAYSLVMMGTSSVIAITWGIINRKYKDKQDRRAEKLRVKQYRQYIAEVEARLQYLTDFEMKRLTYLEPSVVECASFPADDSYRLWERMPVHSDFLSVRLGKGSVPLPGEINIQAKRLQIIDDEMRDEPRRLADTYGEISNAPVAVKLTDYSVIGILGEKNAAALSRSVAMQVTALQSYHDVKLVVICGINQASQWGWARWLPHAFSDDDRSMRMVVSRPSAINDLLSYIDGVLMMRMESAKERENKDEAVRQLPHYVIICTDSSLIEGHAALKRLLTPNLGATLIMLGSGMEYLPKECGLVVDTNQGREGVITAAGDAQKLQIEYPEAGMAERFAHSMASLRVHDVVENTAIPTLVTFLDIYGVRNVDDLDVWRFWNENRAYEGLRSIIGLQSGSRPFVLDISERSHGPHGLVAGTTGSGKSVMLQTYILSLALNYAPDQIQFIIIDYKGGGMADAFKTLPHVAGIIDNLQGERTIARALASIQGEIHRRENAFKIAGVNNIDDYMRLYGGDNETEQFAHLIIIVDEFAELRNEQPDFMRELISASRVGRSVGIHLILATQKPSGSVSSEIWSNTRFRLCLRVADTGDSKDMLKRPEAAYLKGMGRCYVQVGNDEIFELVQTSYSGAEYNPGQIRADEQPRALDDLGRPIKMRSKRSSNRRKVTEMDAVLGRIEQIMNEYHVKPANRLWKEEVPYTIFINTIKEYAGDSFADGRWPVYDEPECKAVIGIGDDVVHQRHFAAWLDFMRYGSQLVVGISASGKTTFLQTLIMSLAGRYSPEDVQMYAFSLSSRTLGNSAELPHMGGIVYEGETDEANRLINMLMTENERRRQLFALASTDSFIEYRRSCRIHSDLESVPAIVVAIDRMEHIFDILSEEMREKLAQLLRESSGRGIYFAASALMLNEVPAKLRTFFRGTALEMREASDYSDVIGRRCPPALANISATGGRGIIATDDGIFEMQTALAGNGTTDVERAESIRAICDEMAGAWHGVLPAPIPRIPENPEFADFVNTPARANENNLQLSACYNQISGLPQVMDLYNQFSWLVVGTRGSGKTNMLMDIALAFKQRDADIYLFNCNGWERRAQLLGATAYDMLDVSITEFLNKNFLNEIDRRRTLRNEAADEDGKRAVVENFQPMVIIMDDLNEIVQKLDQNMAKFMAKYIRQAVRYGIYFLASASQENIALNAMREPIASFVSSGNGILLGTPMSECMTWKCQTSFADRKYIPEMGKGWLINGQSAHKIIIPKAGDR